MADTPRSLAALQALLADNVSGDISPQDVRDFLVSVYAADGLFRDVVVYNNTTNPNYQLDIPSGKVGDTDGIGVIEVSGTLTLDITASGANGLDTGVEANSTWYYIYLIAKSSDGTVASLLSTSASAPTMPADYDMKRLVGAVYNDSSGNFRQFVQVGKDVLYSAAIQVQNGIPSTNWTALNLDTAGAVPPDVGRRAWIVEFVSHQAVPGTFLLYTLPGTQAGAGSGGVARCSVGASAGGQNFTHHWPQRVDASAIFSYYKSASGNTASHSLRVDGFVLK